MITGYVQNAKTITGRISKSKSITSTISKPSSESAKSDHVFVIVDLLKMQTQSLSVNSGNAVVPFTAMNTLSASGQFRINAVPAVVAVNPITANNISLSAVNITVNEEVCTNANQ